MTQRKRVSQDIHGNYLDAVLATYESPTTAIAVVVLIAHNGLYVGEELSLPNNEHTAGLINAGYVDVLPSPILGVDGFR
jgi:hypothetical protein